MIQPLENKNKYFAIEAFQQLEKALENQAFSQIFVVVDENTHQHCLPSLLQNVGALKNYELLEVPVGEEAKSPEVLVQLWEVLSHYQADRDSLIINLGGGVVSDLGGFLAATYMRGIAFINFPTSLLAMADASAGGKTAINLAGFKNRVGAFAQPLWVGVVPQFLETLPQIEKLSGLAEMLKHGLIANAQHFSALSETDLNQSMPVEWLRQTIAIKEQITQQDPKESGLRKILNFGHTLGHALESASHSSGTALTHGHAIALGMQVALSLSVKFSGLSPDAAAEAQKTLSHFYEWPAQSWSKASLQSLLLGDKKNKDGQLRFSLLEKIGTATYDVPVPIAAVWQDLEKFARLV